MNNDKIYEHYPFSLIPLPYAYDALEPYIDTETMRLHHDKHLKAYVDNLNKALSSYPQYHMWTLTQLISNTSNLPKNIQIAVRNNAGGVYNHNLYFSLMHTPAYEIPKGKLAVAIVSTFGSMERFKENFKQAALDRFGSGWAWLVMNSNGKIGIVSTPNQDTPLCQGLCPILLIDVWEHAYYLKYQNRRPEYIDNWFNVINWNEAEQNYMDCMLNRAL